MCHKNHQNVSTNKGPGIHNIVATKYGGSEISQQHRTSKQKNRKKSWSDQVFHEYYLYDLK